MQLSTASLDDAARAVRAFHGATLGALTRGQLLEAQQAAARARRTADVILAAIAGEIAERSTTGGLAKAEGFSTPQRLIAQATGGSLADAHRLVEAGTLLAQNDQSRPGDVSRPDTQEPPAGELAQALREGHISVDAAALVRGTLNRVHAATQAGLAPDDATDGLEVRLTAFARNLNLADLRKACERAEAHASPAAWEVRERRQHQARSVSIGSDAKGMVVLTARLDPPSAAPVLAWLEAHVRDAFQRRRDQDGRALGDVRTPGQVRADALVALARHGLGCEATPTGVSTTVIVRMTLDQLRDASGIGECDTVTTPISASAVRRMAADCEVIPMVLGAESEVIDIGRARRLFSRAQRLALVERDGGCAWCHAPPSYCDAHHIRWWTKDGGRTDLENGLLLCVSCHHRLHDTGWDVTIDCGKVYFVPPAAVDPQRTPRLGGRAQLEQPVAA